MKNVITWVILTLLLLSCNSTKVTVHNNINNSIESDTLSELDYWTSLLCFEPEFWIGKSKSEDKNLLNKSIIDIKNNNYDSAYKSLKKLINSKNDTVKFYAKRVISEILIYKENFNEFFVHNYDSTISKEQNLKNLLYPVFKDFQTKFNFSEIPDTLEFTTQKDLIFIPVEINGKKYNFLFDTGFDLSVIKKSVAEESNITQLLFTENSIVGSTGKYSNSSQAIIENLKLGNIEINDKYCSVLDDDELEFRMFFIKFLNIDGVIGYDIIKNLKTIIDYPNNKIIISKPTKRNKTNEIFWLSQPIVKMKALNGINLYFFLDTGANESGFNHNLTAKSKVKPDGKSFSLTFGIGGSLFKRTDKIDEFYLKWNKKYIKIENFDKKKVDDDLFYTDGVIGIDVFKTEKILIDPTNGIFRIIE